MRSNGGRGKRTRASPRQRPLAFATLVALGALALPASPAFAGDEQELEAAKSRLANGNADSAEERLRIMVAPTGDPCPTTPDLTDKGCRITNPEMLQAARGYYANALVYNGKKDEARKPIVDILLADPSFVPNPTLFPQPVIDLFIEERGKHNDEIAKINQDEAAKLAKARAEQDQQKKERDAYIAALEARASVQVVRHSRFIAAVPFGVGQYQNDEIGWGLFFTVSEVLTAGTSIVTTGVHIGLATQAVAAQNAPPVLDPATGRLKTTDYTTIRQQLQTLEAVDDASLAAFLVLAISGIIEAEVNFKPTVEIKRPELLPPKPKVLVTGVPNAPGAEGLGLRITF